jgi:taurine dioxygenase
MTQLDIRLLTDELPFGARISGVTMANVGDEDVRQRLREVFEDRGMIIFEDIEQSEDMQFAVSEVFGPSQEYAIKNSSFEAKGKKVGLITFAAEERAGTIVEFGGRVIAGHVPWHFDACYAEKLNRAGVLRILVNSPEEGMTGFADGVQIYNALSAEWQAKAEAVDVVYWQFNMFHEQRFGMPEDFRMVQLAEASIALFEASRDIPRTVHPAVWQRKSGEKVLHVSPWQADGVAGMEGPEGDALLEELVQQLHGVMTPYWHDWKPNQMAIWDNWRFVHSASGHDPKYARDARRTTIQGDYGLGCYQKDWKGRAKAMA